MISQTAEYALRAIVYLAGQNGAPRTTAQIAETTMIPAGYLAKRRTITNALPPCSRSSASSLEGSDGAGMVR